MKRLTLSLCLLGLLTSVLGGTTLQTIPFSTSPYNPNMQQSSDAAYSGRWVIRGQQYGVYALNADNGTYKMITGVGKNDGVAPAANIFITGDCWQSFTSLAATPGVAKWVVWIGTPEMCAPSGVPVPAEYIQVARLDGGQGLRWVGQIHAPLVNRLAHFIYTAGDTVWAPEGLYPPTTWTKCDLNVLGSCVSGQPSPAAQAPPQPNIDGYTYSLVGGGPQFHWTMVRSDVQLPTATPNLTPIISVTPSRTPTKTKTGTPGPCAPPAPCPATQTPIGTRTATPVPSPTPAASGCGGVDKYTLCLGERFKVTAQWVSTSGSGAGTAVTLTDDTGTFWFFSAGNYELMVKVLAGCSTNSHYWVFAAGLTNVNVTLTVTDTQTGAIKTYVNPQGTAYQPIQDTTAFQCPAAPARALKASVEKKPLSKIGKGVTITLMLLAAAAIGMMTREFRG